MGPKLLFIFGIILAHGALAAGFMHDQTSKTREVRMSCANTAAPLPYFAPPRELLAMIVVPPAGDVMQP
jgi:hypothetical protein